MGVTLSEEQGESLSAFHALVKDWNTRINLISRKDIDNLLANHILDSLSALAILKERAAAEVLDLGPGGGFPGIPLKICLPDLKMTFLEATQKKARFLELAADELGLPGVQVVAKHSQEAHKDGTLLNRYDYVTARAVAELKELVKMSFPFLKGGGALLAYKSSKAEEEVGAAGDVVKKMGGKVEGVLRLGRELSDKDRRIVIIKKP